MNRRVQDPFASARENSAAILPLFATRVRSDSSNFRKLERVLFNLVHIQLP
jgi:hypothetical protein